MILICDTNKNVRNYCDAKASLSFQYFLKSDARANRCNTANWSNQAEYFEVKRLGESRIVSVPTEFNESDFDKPIIFVSLTMARVTVRSLSLLSVRLV